MGKMSKAPMAYQPTGQAAADQSYQNLVNSATPYATALPQQVIPGLQQSASNVQNNPYYGQAMQGAQGAAAAGSGQVAPQMLQGSNALQALGNLSTAFAPYAAQGAQYAGQVFGQGQNVYNQSQSMLPSVTGGAQYADPALQQLMGMIPGTTQTGMNAADPALFSGLSKAQQAWQMATQGGGMQQGMDAAGKVLQTGFDPQSQLYDREYQKQMDQQNAINAMYGVSGSPYGAGVAGDASRNFNIDWQNQQLQRQISALGAYGNEQGAYANMLNTGAGAYEGLSNAGVNQYTGLTGNAAANASTLANAGVGAYTGLTGNAAQNFANVTGAGLAGLNSGVSGYNSMMGGAVQNLSQLAGTAGNAFSGAGQQGTDALNVMTQAANAPNQTFMQQQQAQIAALQALAQGTGQALSPTQQMIDDQAKYLGIGQQATQLNQTAVAQRNAATAATWQAVGQMVGTAAAFII